MLIDMTIPQVGKINWIGIRRKRKIDLEVVETAEISEEEGLVGDRYRAKNKKRQITLIQKEHLDVVASLVGKKSIDPNLTRRNIVVSGINLIALKKMKFKLGDVILEGTGACPPCSRMEENLGAGGFHAMRGHGGITARVIKGGKISLGDAVSPVTRQNRCH